jgi:CRISPR-associated protein Csy2
MTATADLVRKAAALVLLPNLRIQNANAISGPLSWGFPSPTAFTGFAHALQRKVIEHRLSASFHEGFGGVGIICHDFQPQVSWSSGERAHVFHLTRNPAEKDGGAPAMVEEGRAHIKVSLVIAVKDALSLSEGERFAQEVFYLAQDMRLAGGSLLPETAEMGELPAVRRWWPLGEGPEGQLEVLRRLRRCLIPGFALVQRNDLLIDHLADMRARQADSETMPNMLDALLDFSRLNIEPRTPHPGSPDEARWDVRRKPGWLVPLPIGYSVLSPLYSHGEVQNARDGTTPFGFAESLYSLGEWISPNRVENLDQLLWHTESQPENGIYCCINRYSSYLDTVDEQRGE